VDEDRADARTAPASFGVKGHKSNLKDWRIIKKNHGSFLFFAVATTLGAKNKKLKRSLRALCELCGKTGSI